MDLPPYYEIKQDIGCGAFGSVSKVLNKETQKIEAVKKLMDSKKIEHQRFQREIKLLSELEHKNIVKIHDYNIDKLYFSMEYVDGGTFKDIIRDNNISLERKLKIVIEISEAISFAHEQNIIHRDLKPENILVTKELQPKISDFGLAKMLAEEEEFTKTKQSMGTPLYMSPEQWDDLKRVDHRADVWSLGIILYEMVFGHPPYRNTFSLIGAMHQEELKIPLPRNELSPIELEFKKNISKSIGKEKRKTLPKYQRNNSGIKNHTEKIRSKKSNRSHRFWSIF